jgi:fructose-bisphosphate aldolase class II
MKAQINSIQESLKDEGSLDYFEIIYRTVSAGKEMVKYYIQLSQSEGKSQ